MVPLDNSLVFKSRTLSNASLYVNHQKRIDRKHPFAPDNETGNFYYKAGTQITASRGNRFQGMYSGDLGGPFGTSKSLISINEKRFRAESKDELVRLNTVVLPPAAIGFFQETHSPQLLEYPSDLNALGASAISFCNPVNPIADASTTFAEAVREGVPVIPGASFWKSRAKAFLGISSEFLNAEFGWLPLVDEITKFGNAVKKSRDILQQYKRDEGKLVRRKFSFPISESSSIITETPGQTPYLLAKNGGSYGWSKYVEPNPLGTAYTTDKTVHRVWFSGAFVYYIPDQNDPWSGIMRHGSDADKLFGTSLTPEILWELAPWSWAVDYFSNAQQVITNLQNFEIYGEILAYGYVMDESVLSRHLTMEKENEFSSFHSSCSTVSRVKTRKLRKAANPFGFGLTAKDLSLEQLAILAAAGITLLL